jgi:predicted dehydrogenase
MKQSETSRREFLRRSVLTGAGLTVVGRPAFASSTAANEKLNIAIVGVEGRGAAHVDALSKMENVVALCDVDETRLESASRKVPQAAKHVDFRRMLDAMEKSIDAVVVATPDHTHAVAALAAMDMGKHVYCEKPLTHSVYEARQLAKMAERKKVVTQMGNQGHSNDGTRRVVELVRAGVIGPVREVHCWTDRPASWWPQGIERPHDRPPVPPTLHWDLWLGPAPERPYHPAYHPFKWRGWWDFGTGALGDMACHVMDTAFWALDLSDPISVEADGEPHLRESAPNWMVVRYEFGARGEMPPCALTWYDSKRTPPKALFMGEKIPDNGTLLVGDKGSILSPDPYGSTYVLLPRQQYSGFQPPAPSIPNSIGHHAEWVAACKQGKDARKKPGSNFSYSGPLTEMVLLGNVAFRVGHKLYWDRKEMKATNCSEADQYVRGARDEDRGTRSGLGRYF